MNILLLKNKYSQVEPYLKYGFNAMDTGDYKLPIELWPNEVPQIACYLKRSHSIF
jgi:hypothetical protein